MEKSCMASPQVFQQVNVFSYFPEGCKWAALLIKGSETMPDSVTDEA